MPAPQPYREERPWGEFVEYTRNTPCTVKIITVNPGQAFSLQHHTQRDEFWRVMSGQGMATVGTASTVTKPGDTHFIPRGTQHRMEAQAEPLVFLEISYGEFDENDIVRTDDRYGRVK